MNLGEQLATAVDSLVALGTAALAIAAFLQLKWHKEREEKARFPRPFLKDIWIAGDPETRTDDSGERLVMRLKTKNLANLSTFAIAIHRLCIVDIDGVPLAWAHPMRVIPAGAAWKADDKAQPFVTALTPRGKWLPESDFRMRANRLLIEFRSGADTGERWALELQAKPSLLKSRWVNFRGEGSAPVRVSDLAPALRRALD